MRRILATGLVLAAVGALLAAPPPPANAPNTPDAHAFVKQAILNGLAEDGVPPALVRELAERSDFVSKCEICGGTETAFREYAKLNRAPAAKEGKGLPEDLVKRLKSDKTEVRHPALRELVQRYIDWEYARLDLTADQKKAFQQRLEDVRKGAMGNLRDGQKFCPSCDGACRRTPKL